MKPILFNSEMIRAVLDGRKTQTRRIIKPQLPTRYNDGTLLTKPFVYTGLHSDGIWHGWLTDERDGHGLQHAAKCPYGKVGDKLWVRETFKISNRPHGDDGHYRMVYMADKAWVEIDYSEIDMGRLKPGKTYPSIFMPRWASRVTLEIINIWVERVQQINEGNSCSEGIKTYWDGTQHWYKNYLGSRDFNGYKGAKNSFHSLWDSINAKRGYGWEKNPWVWVVEFRRIDNGILPEWYKWYEVPRRVL